VRKRVGAPLLKGLWRGALVYNTGELTGGSVGGC
jgi:hypothetical protein